MIWSARSSQDPHLDDKLQVADTCPSRNAREVGEYLPGKLSPGALAAGGFAQQVGIKCKQHATQFSRPVQDRRISLSAPAILLDRQHIHAPGAQSCRDRPGDMLIHVEA